MYGKMKKTFKKNCKCIKTIFEKKKNKQKTQYLTVNQTNRIAHMGMNVTIWM